MKGWSQLAPGSGLAETPFVFRHFEMLAKLLFFHAPPFFWVNSFGVYLSLITYNRLIINNN